MDDGYRSEELEGRLSRFETAWQAEEWKEDASNDHLLRILCNIRKRWGETFFKATDRF